MCSNSYSRYLEFLEIYQAVSNKLLHFRRLAVDHENVKPDILILGKALSGGIMPVSKRNYLQYNAIMQVCSVIHSHIQILTL